MGRIHVHGHLLRCPTIGAARSRIKHHPVSHCNEIDVQNLAISRELHQRGPKFTEDTIEIQQRPTSMSPIRSPLKVIRIIDSNIQQVNMTSTVELSIQLMLTGEICMDHMLLSGHQQLRITMADMGHLPVSVSDTVETLVEGQVIMGMDRHQTLIILPENHQCGVCHHHQGGINGLGHPGYRHLIGLPHRLAQGHHLGKGNHMRVGQITDGTMIRDPTMRTIDLMMTMDPRVKGRFAREARILMS